GSLSFVMYFSKFIIHQSVLYVILFFKKLVKWCKGKYVVSPGTSFTLEPKDTELKTAWAQVTDEIKNTSWKAMYAKNNAEFDQIVKKMEKNAKAYGYDACIEWSKSQAERRHQLEQELKATK
ncbi:MAG: hypothetical protein HFH70_13820, partial [Lachnospiraceae bacterium]|nr:hypothetical protein [Lachnospiraceae bacterium]